MRTPGEWLVGLLSGGVPADAQLQMGWRYVRYQVGDRGVDFAIEPAEDGPDVVAVPDPSSWQETAPEWARSQRRQILRALKAKHWQRDLIWRDSATPVRECGRL